MSADVIDAAAAAIDRGELVVYPTETVYGLAADALDAEAVERLFAAKGRDRDKPVSMAVPDVATAADHTRLTDRERAFVQEFLPGPVTVVVERGPEIPDVLTAGRDRVGLRIPDHEVALDLVAEAGPITATSANVSGTGSVRDLAQLRPAIREQVAAVIDDGETPGGGSTVVDVERGEIHRRGALAAEIDAWLAART